MTLLLTILGTYYVITGVWPLISIRTFMMVTGPKTDLWLVKMVGLLAAASGTVYLFAVYLQGELSIPLMLLIVLNALAFIIIDIYYVIRQVISPIYLMDAVFQIIILAMLFVPLV